MLPRWLPSSFPSIQFTVREQITIEDFDENDIQGLLEEKHQKTQGLPKNTSSVSSKTAYSNICKTVQTRLRDMQTSWLSKTAEEIQSFADRKDMKKFFYALKTINGPQSSGTTHSLV